MGISQRHLQAKDLVVDDDGVSLSWTQGGGSFILAVL
jgi:hypothetical protein